MAEADKNEDESSGGGMDFPPTESGDGGLEWPEAEVREFVGVLQDAHPEAAVGVIHDAVRWACRITPRMDGYSAVLSAARTQMLLQRLVSPNVFDAPGRHRPSA